MFESLYDVSFGEGSLYNFNNQACQELENIQAHTKKPLNNITLFTLMKTGFALKDLCTGCTPTTPSDSPFASIMQSAVKRR